MRNIVASFHQSNDRLEKICLIFLIVFTLILILSATHLVGLLDKGVRGFELVSDDSYYYIKIAVNFWHTGRFTFDSITSTNGFQPLWQVMLVLLAAPLVLLDNTWLMPTAVLITSSLLLIITCLLLIKILKLASLSVQLQLPVLVLLITVMVDFVIGGMESILMLVAVAWFSLYWLKVYKGDIEFKYIPFTGLSLLVVLSRLDLGIFLMAIYFFSVKPLGLKTVIYSGLILVAIATPYFIWNHTTFGGVVPISGQAKEFWEHLEYYHNGLEQNESRNPGQVYIYTKELGQRITDHIPGPFGILSLLLRFIMHPYLVVGLLIGRAVAVSRIPAGHWIMWTSLVTTLLCYGTLQIYYYSYVGYRIWGWYLVISAAALIIVIGTGLLRVLVGFFGQRTTSVIALALGGLFVLYVLGTSVAPTIWKDIKNWPAVDGIEETGDAIVIKWVDANLPKDQVIGAWAAGLIGFRTERAVINLEGLVSDNDMLESNKRLDLVSSILEHDVRYIIQHFENDPFKYIVNDKPVFHIRKKQFVEFPACFDVLFESPAGVDTEYVFGVDLECLERGVAYKEEIASTLSTLGTLIQAERFDTWSSRPLVRMDLSGVWNFFIEDGKVTYDLGDNGHEQILVARVMNKTGEALPLGVSMVASPDKGTISVKAIAGAWQCIEMPEPISTNDILSVDVPKGLALDALFLTNRVATVKLIAHCVE